MRFEDRQALIWKMLERQQNKKPGARRGNLGWDPPAF